METLLLVVIFLLIILVIFSFIIFSMLLFKNLKRMEAIKPEKDAQLLDKGLHQGAREKVLKAQEEQEAIELNTQYCVDHSELIAKGICSLSGNAYCELCITKHDGIKVARKYLGLLVDSKWKQLGIYHFKSFGADKYNELMTIKKEIWQGQNLPIIAQRQFKINVEEDKVEEYISVQVRVEDEEVLSSKLSLLL